MIQALRDDAEGLENKNTDNQQVSSKQEELKEGEQDQITEKKEENSAKSKNGEDVPPPTSNKVPLQEKLKKLNISASQVDEVDTIAQGKDEPDKFNYN